MGLRKSRTTYLCFRKVEECRISLEIPRVFKSFRMSYLYDGLTNLLNCINYKIINARGKSLTITVWLGSHLRESRSWYLIYYRNFTKRLEVCLSMMTKLINFSFRNKVQRFFRRDTLKLSIWRRVLLWNIRWTSVRRIKSGLYRNIRRISFDSLSWNKMKWHFKSILWINCWMFHFSQMWLVRACWTLVSIMHVGHKLNNKAKLETLVQWNHIFTLYMKSTTTFNLWNGYDN